MRKIYPPSVQIPFGKILLSLCVSIVLLGLGSFAFSAYSKDNLETVENNLAGTTAPENIQTKKLCCGQTENFVETFTLIGSYYSLKNGQETTLMFNNKGPEPLIVNPAFFNLSGHRLDLPALTIAPKSYQEFDLRVLLVNYLPQFREGSLQVSHQGGRLQLGAQFKILKQGVLFDEQFIQPATRFPSTRLESVWYLPSPQANTKFILSNTTDSPVTTTVEVSGTAPHQQQPTVIQLSAHETRVLDILRDLVGQQNGGTLKKDGGISINHTGTAGAIMARILISEPINGYSSVVNFTDPTTSISSKLNGGGLRIGSIGNDKLEPIISARNIGTETTTVSGQIPYTDANGEIAFVTIPATQILPDKSKIINLRQQIEAANVPSNVTFAGLNLEYTTAPGSVVMNAQSVSQSGEQVFQVPLLDPERLPSSAGGFPWKVDGDYTTVIFIKNESDTLKKYVANLTFEGGTYSLGVRELKPWQTEMVDFKQLRDSQTPDSSGHLIPQNIQRGQASWTMMGASNKKMSGRSEQVNTVIGISSTYACYNCCPDSIYSTGQTFPTQFETETGGGIQFLLQAESVNCYGGGNGTFSLFGYGWLSSNTGIGTIDNGGNSLAIASGLVDFVGYFQSTRYDFDGRDCIETNFVESGTGQMGVTPTITSITPEKGSVGGKISVSIDGSGFTSSTTISPITGITFSDVEVYGSSQMSATFNISGNATAGNNEVKVTTSGMTSNSKNFFVQIPKKARRDEIADTVVIEPGPGDIVNIFGQTVETGVCGAYRNLKYTLIDQDSEELELGTNEGLTVTEILSNFQSPSGFPQPAAKTVLTNNVGEFGDILAVFQSHPGCPAMFNFTATQKFKVTIGSKDFLLTTQNTLALSKTSTAQWTINAPNVTP
jgi:hypothetical protein